MPSARALMRMLMSLDTRMTLRFGCACDRCMTTAMIWLSALPPASDGGSVGEIASVCRKNRPVAAPPAVRFKRYARRQAAAADRDRRGDQLVEIARRLPRVARDFGDAFL